MKKVVVNANNINSEDLQKLKIELDMAYNEFDNIPHNEHHLIDSCIHRINYLQSRIDYIISVAKRSVIPKETAAYNI